MSLTMIKQNQVTTMSSREIAELTGKEHRNIKRDVQNMCKQLNLDVLSFEQTYLDGSNRQQTEYALPRRECEILVTGYDVKRRAAVIDRWFELESTKADLPTSMEAFAKLFTHAAKQEKQLLLTQSKINAIGSDVEDIKSKVNKIKDLSEQLDFGHVTLKDGWAKYCNVCSYDVFREFAAILGLPMKPFNHVPDGTIVIVKTHQVKISDLNKLRDHIVKNSIQKSKTLWEHPDLNHKFKLREL